MALDADDQIEQPLDEVESNLFLNINTKNRDIRQFLNTT